MRRYYRCIQRRGRQDGAGCAVLHIADQIDKVARLNAPDLPGYSLGCLGDRLAGNLLPMPGEH
jgi:hypothetical protein